MFCHSLELQALPLSALIAFPPECLISPTGSLPHIPNNDIVTLTTQPLYNAYQNEDMGKTAAGTRSHIISYV